MKLETRFEDMRRGEISDLKLRLASDLQSVCLENAMAEIHPSILQRALEVLAKAAVERVADGRINLLRVLEILNDRVLVLYQLTDEDALQVASELGLERPLTADELIDIRKCVENGLGEFWFDVMKSAVSSCVEELKGDW